MYEYEITFDPVTLKLKFHMHLVREFLANYIEDKVDHFVSIVKVVQKDMLSWFHRGSRFQINTVYIRVPPLPYAYKVVESRGDTRSSYQF